jgi:uncharacterized protein (TIGR02271 family)
MNERVVPAPPDEQLVRHEEELEVGRRTVEAGSVVVHKDVETREVHDTVAVGSERADVERSDVLDEDSGQVETLPDGSISVPVFEEELVVTKRLRVRERIIIRKRTEMHDEVVRGEVRMEHVEIENTREPEMRENA